MKCKSVPLHSFCLFTVILLQEIIQLVFLFTAYAAEYTFC